jgi:hypothetical protein
VYLAECAKLTIEFDPTAEKRHLKLVKKQAGIATLVVKE